MHFSSKHYLRSPQTSTKVFGRNRLRLPASSLQKSCMFINVLLFVCTAALASIRKTQPSPRVPPRKTAA